MEVPQLCKLKPALKAFRAARRRDLRRNQRCQDGGQDPGCAAV